MRRCLFTTGQMGFGTGALGALHNAKNREVWRSRSARQEGVAGIEAPRRCDRQGDLVGALAAEILPTDGSAVL